MGRKRTGVSDRVTSDVVRRLMDIRALWFAVHNDPKFPVDALATEFFFAVGDVFEGKHIENIETHKIDKARVLRHVREG